MGERWAALGRAFLIGLWLGVGTLAGAEPGGEEGAGLGEGVEELAEALESKDGAARRRAVRDLAQLGGRAAWELVIGALADPKGEVADEAQFQLARLDDERLLRKLRGKVGLGSKDPLIRQRVAEALGRSLVPVDGEQILASLSRRDPEMSELLLWSLERLAVSDGLVGDRSRCARILVRLVRQAGPIRVRSQALCSLAVLDAGEAEALIPALLQKKEHELRVAALECLGRLDDGQAFAAGERAGADPHPAVRLIALELMASEGSKRSLSALVDRMEVEERLRLRLACAELLSQLSGRKHKLNARSWRHWIGTLDDDWQAREGGPSQPEVGGTASFGGLPIMSDRVCFLIDFSGSLWFEREGRPARKGKVDELLREALQRLSAEVEFNIIPYTGVPHPWRESLVPAKPRNVRKALEDFEASTHNGSGNVFEAVKLALTDRKVDRIVILTDGAPTGGSRWKLELMVPLLCQAARFDRVAFDAIVVDARPGLRKHWEGLAHATGGRALAIEL